MEALVAPLKVTSDTSSLNLLNFTLVYDGDLQYQNRLAWTSDMQLDEAGFPLFCYSLFTKDPISRGGNRSIPP